MPSLFNFTSEKVLTPSDVGKLYRLVIPKHVQKNLPLFSNQEMKKGVSLSFEDESGMLRTFRYSYCDRSRSCVFTKGWRDYVKKKQLDAGDVVSFLHRTPDQKLYIRYKRSFATIPASVAAPVHDSTQSNSFLDPPSTSSSSAKGSKVYHSGHSVYPPHQQHSIDSPSYNEAVAAPPVAQAPVPTKNKVKLFGVYID